MSICLSLCIVGFTISFFYKRTMNASTCGLIQFTFNSINGIKYSTLPKWAGYQNLKNLFDSTIAAVDDLDANYSLLFPYYDSIVTQDTDYIDSIITYSTEYGEKEIKSPNPDSTEKIHPIYQSLYAPYTTSSTSLGYIYSTYMNSINLIVTSMKNIKSDIDNIKSNSSDLKVLLTSLSSEFDNLITVYTTIENNLVENYLKIKNLIIDKLALSSQIIYGMAMALMILCIVMTAIYSCKTSPNAKKMKYFIHVYWNIMLAIIILLILLSSFFGVFMVITKDIIPIFHYLVSEDYLSNESIYGTLSTNTVKYFQLCINNTNNDLSSALSLKTSLFSLIDSLYQHYNQLKIYTEAIEQYETDIVYFEENNNMLKEYSEDFSLTTDSTYTVHDVTYCLNQFSRWTDYSHEEAIQTECGLGTQDQWVGNNKYCKENYVYSLSASYEKNCLVISDWRIELVTQRYLTACLSVEGNPVNTGAQKFFGSINKYNTDNINLLNQMIKGNNYLKAEYLNIISEIKLELENNKKILDEFVEPYTEFNKIEEDSSTYEMFNCSIIKNDLIGFYDKLHYEFKVYSIVEISMTFSIAIFSYMSTYFMIRSIYRAQNTIDEKQESPSSSMSSDRKNEKDTEKQELTNNNNNNNMVLSDNKGEEEKKTNPMGMIYDENNVSGSNPSSNKSNSQSNQSKSDESGNKSVASNQESEVNTGNVQVNLINPRDRRTNNNLINNPSLTTKIKL